MYLRLPHDGVVQCKYIHDRELSHDFDKPSLDKQNDLSNGTLSNPMSKSHLETTHSYLIVFAIGGSIEHFD